MAEGVLRRRRGATYRSGRDEHRYRLSALWAGAVLAPSVVDAGPGGSLFVQDDRGQAGTTGLVLPKEELKSAVSPFPGLLGPMEIAPG